jgi:DNA (cytosine-5)-methyltransferase 1
MKPRLLDLFCGAGGAAMGYHRAGFEVVGVDINPQPHYPFEFHQADAMTYPLDGFDAIHASPPCQAYSVATAVHGPEVVASHPDLVAMVRLAFTELDVPFVIENVPGAPLRGTLLLCGSMFGLEVRRHRIFEGTVPMMSPLGCNHLGAAVPVYGHTGAGANRGRERDRGRSNGVADWRRAMGIDWMTVNELAESIPPAYTEWIGSHLMRQLRAVA